MYMRKRRWITYLTYPIRSHALALKPCVEEAHTILACPTDLAKQKGRVPTLLLGPTTGD